MLNLPLETVAMIIGPSLEVGRDVSPGCGRLRCCHVRLCESLPVATGADAVRRLLGRHDLMDWFSLGKGGWFDMAMFARLGGS